MPDHHQEQRLDAQIEAISAVVRTRFMQAVHAGGSCRRFMQALHTLERSTLVPGAGRLAWIVLDTPPPLSSYTRAALTAAHAIAIPTIVEPFAVTSINRLLETAETMRSLMGRDGRILGSHVVRWPRSPSRQSLTLGAQPTPRHFGQDVGSVSPLLSACRMAL